MATETAYITATLDEYFERRRELLADIDYKIVRKAWFALSHLLLNENAVVADMGCDDGAITYAMAALAPNIRFVGVDKNKRSINKAKELYENKVHNLEYIAADISTAFAKPESFDAIVNSYVLYDVFSHSKYNEKTISETLDNHFKMLKTGGLMFIRDFARPPPEEYVLLEMPDLSVDTDDLTKMSETDLLIWYSEHARPRQDAGCGGFYLEELPPRFPKTRLFRLPHKWAYEFLMRKDDREKWDKHLPVEYTCFTMREYRKELRSHGARVFYSAPHWDDEFIEKNFDGRFRLYSAEGELMGHPPTCYLAVAQKMKDRQSLVIGERRPSKSETSAIRITAMRNEVTGDITDVIARDFVPAEILPYHVNEEGRLKIYLHDGIPRGMANTVPRYGENVDGKRWSGHMIETLTVDQNTINEISPEDIKDTVKFARDHLGLKPRNNALLFHGPDYYPAPDYIDERIKTFFLNVERNTKEIKPKMLINNKERYQAKGVIREFDAQQVLNAITVGLLPNARLELQILSLFEFLSVKPETWTDREINIQKQKIIKKADTKDLLAQISEKDERFKEVKGTAGQLRTVHSIFVEEGLTQGSEIGLSSDEMDFVVSDQKTINTAIVIPLTKGIQDDLHAGIMVDYLPIPQRHEGNGLTMHAPSFNIPAEITNLKQMKKYIADQFGLKPENVIKLGESYFSHIGITQHRIYPFAVAAPPEAFAYSKTSFIPFHQYRLLWSSLSKDTHFMVVIARAWQMLSDEIKNDYKLRVKEIVRDRFSGKVADWSIPMTYAPPPGKRPDADAKAPELSMDKLGAKVATAAPATQATTPKTKTESQKPEAPKPEKPLQKLRTSATPFHLLSQRDAALIKPEPNGAADQPAQEQKAPVKTDVALSNEFTELEELAKVVEKNMPLDEFAPKPDKW
ncbi:MAG: methyltransferase domain-containing protein [Alphaproteobacteria bacterium]